MRNERVDNLKGILTVLVVFGHFLELIMDQGWTKYVYELIYSFHMPFFIFTSGYFYKYKIEKIIDPIDTKNTFTTKFLTKLNRSFC